MKVIAITQARTGSTRLPNKVLKKIKGKMLLNIHLERILKTKTINQLIVATTTDPADDAIEEIANKMGIAFYRGSVYDVLDRYYQAAKMHNPEWVVRLTSDCPLIDADLLDAIIDKALELNVDYCSNSLDPTYPDGMDVEVFKYSALEKAWKEAKLDSEREHVTPYIYKNSSFYNRDLFTAFNFCYHSNYKNVRLTVDEQADFEVISQLIEKLGVDEDWKTYADCYLGSEKVKDLNKDIERNDGYIKSVQND
jgi:spore coat polysaccharide biosynthesis protein SpsF